MSAYSNKIEFGSVEKSVFFIVQRHQGVLQCRYYLSLEESLALPVNKFDFHNLKDALC